ncbi:uncharacterized protein ATNIH1004_011767 [Aspergillus tanneri]|uniref:Uncharacterized protein n=1 Tax=Aspergillus tanneri TaxID=1220188 RepID=A0A5M9M4K0_9EURO|nr:uncharacterized protein ATNIH1004_011767 [Aspergillus tanneri]KAA8641631.1 hypothetical protein ATNIH1004_011767 [Aspergillus tanneri]
MTLKTHPYPPIPSGTISKSSKFYFHKPKWYPLSAHPPVEVCLDSSLHSDARTTRHEPEDLGRTTSADPYSQAFDSENTLLGQVLLGAENIDPAIINNIIFPDIEHIQASQDPAVIDGYLSQSPRFPITGAPFQSSQHGAEDMVMLDLQYPRVAKLSIRH